VFEPEELRQYRVQRRMTDVKFLAAASHPPSQWIPGAKQLDREANHSSPFSVEVKNIWSYISTLSYMLMAWCIIKHE
jgi:hypothetical protein